MNIGREPKNYKTSNAGNIKLNTGHKATIYKNYKTWSHCHSAQARQSQETKITVKQLLQSAPLNTMGRILIRIHWVLETWP